MECMTGVELFCIDEEDLRRMGGVRITGEEALYTFYEKEDKDLRLIDLVEILWMTSTPWGPKRPFKEDVCLWKSGQHAV